jgi:hypothetical protein
MTINKAERKDFPMTASLCLVARLHILKQEFGSNEMKFIEKYSP